MKQSVCFFQKVMLILPVEQALVPFLCLWVNMNLSFAELVLEKYTLLTETLDDLDIYSKRTYSISLSFKLMTKRFTLSLFFQLYLSTYKYKSNSRFPLSSIFKRTNRSHQINFSFVGEAIKVYPFEIKLTTNR